MENEKKNPIVIIDAKPFIKDSGKKEAKQNKDLKKTIEDVVKEEMVFSDLNSVLVKFWKEENVRDKEVKIRLLERMLGWYKKMGTITLDDLTLTE